MIYDAFYVDVEKLPAPKAVLDELRGQFFLTNSFRRGLWKFFVTEAGFLEVKPASFKKSNEFQGCEAERFRLCDASGRVAFFNFEEDYFFIASFDKGALLSIQSARRREVLSAQCEWTYSKPA